MKYTECAIPSEVITLEVGLRQEEILQLWLKVREWVISFAFPRCRSNVWLRLP